jgi:hypothetical protein
MKLRLPLLLGLTVLAASQNLLAYDLVLSTNTPAISFHGFASQGYLLTSDYNYLANDTRNGSFQFSEFGLNAAMNPFPKTRIAVQGFDFDVGNVGQYDPILDYALIEYTYNDEVGLRAGRIRRPGGIYNDIQDIDLARTFVLLPQGLYDARWRDWSCGLDGGELFGEIPLRKAGSLSYAAYGGFVSMADNGGVARYVANANDAQVEGIDTAPAFGGQIWYNTPVDGLRVGASISYLSDFGFTANSTTEIPISPTVFVPGFVNSHTVGNVLLQQYSVEYLWRSWTFQAEYQTYDFTGWSHAQVSVPAVRAEFNRLVSMEDNPEAWYAAVSYRFNKWVEAGTYYTMWDAAGLKQNDLALSLRLDLRSWWVFKIEGHYLEGTGLLRDSADNPQVDNNSGWFMLAVKTTFSF